MGPESKAKYLSILDQEITAGDKSLGSIEHARNTADSPMTSRYDTMREIYAQEANVKREQLGRVRGFRDFVATAQPQQRIVEGAEFTLELWDEGDRLENVIFSPDSVKVPGIQVITPQSPIGQAIAGLTTGDTFTYQVHTELMAGIVKKVE